MEHSICLGEINFHQNRTEPRHDSMCKLCAAAQFEFQPPEKKHAAAQVSTIVLCRGTVANRNAKTHNTEKLGFKRAKTHGIENSSLLGHIGELCGVLGHGFWWRSSWRLKFERDFGFTLRFFFSIFLPSLLFNVYD